MEGIALMRVWKLLERGSADKGHVVNPYERLAHGQGLATQEMPR